MYSQVPDNMNELLDALLWVRDQYVLDLETAKRLRVEVAFVKLILDLQANFLRSHGTPVPDILGQPR